MEVETTKMSTRGQVIIPKEIRDYISADEGTLFAVATLDEETIVMKKLSKQKLVQEFRDLRERVKNKLTEEEILDEVQAHRRKAKSSY